jgi:hypothetical protein
MALAYLTIPAFFIVAIVAQQWFCAAQGLRVTSGRTWARLAYASLIVEAVLAFLILHLLMRLQAPGRKVPEFRWLVQAVTVLLPPLLVLSILTVWLAARALNRSLIFYNVRRDQLGPTVAEALKDAGVAFTHRLGIFKDVFRTPAGRVVVHGAPGTCRLQWPGRDPLREARWADEVIQRLGRRLAPGRTLVDARDSAAMANRPPATA